MARRVALLLAFTLGVPTCLAVRAQAPSSAAESRGNPAVEEPTVEQFRDYLALSGVGEIWRANWIAAVDPTWKRIAAPYWPASFERDILEEMKKTDVAPSVWTLYRSYYSRDRMNTVNSLLREKGIQGYLASTAGGEFCAVWAKHEEEGKRELMTLTTSVLQRVYTRDMPGIKAARAKYLKEHPEYKD